jgi:hypothetical protein
LADIEPKATAWFMESEETWGVALETCQLRVGRTGQPTRGAYLGPEGDKTLRIIKINWADKCKSCIRRHIVGSKLKPKEGKILKTHANKIQENKSQSVSNLADKREDVSQSTFRIVDDRSEAVSQRKLQKMANNSQQVSQLRAFQDLADNYSYKQKFPIQRRQNQVIQRITEEDSRQAVYIIRGSVGRHGYTVEAIRSILEHRFSEIMPGRRNQLLLGLGADEGNADLGSIIYDCYLNPANGIYTIDAFHAHGAQLEGSHRGY